MNMKGISLLEFLFALGFLALLSVVGSSEYQKRQILKSQNSPVYCYEGYKFYKHKQVLDVDGKGIPCVL